MINYENALELAKRMHKNETLHQFFFYSGKYVFSVFHGKEVVDGDPTSYFISIDANTGEHSLFNFWKEIVVNDDPEFISAVKNAKPVI